LISEASVSTSGPAGRFGAVLFLEKEGFNEILEAARIAERFDIAIMSTKGLSVTASRRLVDALAADGVRLFVLHDFDIAGFSIRKTLTESGRRHRFVNKLDFVDIGLRLADVERLGLDSEGVVIGKDADAVRRRLLINGATEAEADFLLSGRRVELNAMASDMFVRFIEEKLIANGVRKVIPDAALLAEAYTAFVRAAKAKEALRDELARLKGEPVEVPPDLEKRARERLAKRPEDTWDRAVRAIVEEEDDEDAGDAAAGCDGVPE
jgi:hypothetical protein